MAAFTSKADGNWSAAGQTTWTEVGVPASGDSVIIQTGHDITVDANTTVGQSAAQATTWGNPRDFVAEPPAIELQGTATLTVAAGITLIVKGDIDCNSDTPKPVTLAAGASLKIDNGNSNTILYKLNNLVLTCNGTLANPCTLDGNIGSGTRNGMIDGRNAGGSQASTCTTIATYTTFTRWGIAGDSYGINLSPPAQPQKFIHCVFDGCGRVGYPSTAIFLAQDFIWQYTTFKNSLHATDCVGTIAGSVPSGGAARVLDSCVFDKNIAGLASWTATEVSNNIFANRLTGSGIVLMGEFHHNYLNITNAGGGIIVRSLNIHDNYITTSATTNPHGLLTTNIAGHWDVNANIFEQTATDGGDGSGDIIFPVNAAGYSVTVRYNILLTNSSGKCPGKLISMLGDANLVLHAYHNTVCTTAGEAGLMGVGETYAGYAGMVPNSKSNLIWTAPNSVAGWKARRGSQATAVQDIITPSGWDYNWGWNLGTGSEGNGFDDLDAADPTSMFSVVPTDANGGSGDPGFLDYTHNILSWDFSLGGDGTVAHAVAQMSKLNDADFDTNYTVTNLLAYVRAGFAPSNSDLKDAGHDSVTIGAVEGVFEPVNTALPIIAAGLFYGREGLSTAGGWTGVDSYAYQWYRADDGSGTNLAAITSATALEYTPVAADEGKYLKCRVTTTNTSGSTSADSNYKFCYVRAALPAPTLVERDLTALASYDGKFLFTESMDDVTIPPVATPNPVTWKAQAPQNGVDWSFFTVAANASAGARNSGGGCTKLSPDWGVVAYHVPGDATGYVFMKANGTELSRATDQLVKLKNSSDIALVHFTSPIADVDIPPVPIFNASAYNSVAGQQFLGIEMDRHLNVLLMDSGAVSTSETTDYTATTADIIEGGDSGKPGLILVGTQPVLVLSALYTASDGPNPTCFIDEICAVLATTGDAPTLLGFSGGESSAIKPSPKRTCLGTIKTSPLTAFDEEFT